LLKRFGKEGSWPERSALEDINRLGGKCAGVQKIFEKEGGDKRHVSRVLKGRGNLIPTSAQMEHLVDDLRAPKRRGGRTSGRKG